MSKKQDLIICSTVLGTRNIHLKKSHYQLVDFIRAVTVA